MHRVLLTLMIILLPMRGLVGEAMATEMATMKRLVSATVDAPASIALPAEHPMSHCDMSKVMQAEPSTENTACNNCQACQATGVPATLELSSFGKIQYAQPLAQAHSDTSACLAPSKKPPIF